MSELAERTALQGSDWTDFRDHIPTVDEHGKRRWLYPKKPEGRLYRRRSWVSYLLLLILFSGPFIRINGNPLLMMNIVEPKFSIFGQIFWPHDTFIFAVGMLVIALSIFLFTAVFGRVWCGWACPQTIFMEMVFRRIEYWIEGDGNHQKTLDAAPWTAGKAVKKISKHVIFFAISFLIGNLLLAYIIGSDQLKRIVTEPPSQHTAGLTFMILFSLLFYGIFARFREQACTFICPYGRLQSVLLDDSSIVVSYDFVRGEDRARIQRGDDFPAERAEGRGDCIDCHLCVAVCPTGIDIRDGTQMECVNCTACIDACDSIMDKLGLPQGLVRFASVAGIRDGKKLRFGPRIAAYSLGILVLIGMLIFLVGSRAEVQATLLRNPGTLAQELSNGEIVNFYTLRVMNKSNEPIEVDVRLLEPAGEVRIPGLPLIVPGQGTVEKPAIVALSADSVSARANPIVVGVFAGNEQLHAFETNFYAPGSSSGDSSP